jgi:uncharacterized protein
LPADSATYNPARGPLASLLRLTLIFVGGIGVILFALAYASALHWTHPVRAAPVTSPADYGLTFEDVTLHTSDGLKLAAWYVPPTNRAVIIVVHGIGGNRSGDLPTGSRLASRGYGLLLLDLRAHGDSEGITTSLGPHEVKDVAAAVEFLRGRAEVDPERIGIYGASLGAAVAVLAGAELPQLKAVVTASGFSSLDWLVREQFNALESVPQWLAPLIVWIGALQAGVDPDQIAPVKEIARISPRPVLIIHGDEDHVFRVENAYLLAEAAKDPKQLWIMPGVGHWGGVPADYSDRIAAFYDEALLR